MQWFKKNWLWVLFNCVALLIFLSLASRIIKTTNDIRVIFLFDGYLSNLNLNISSPLFQQSGRWARGQSLQTWASNSRKNVSSNAAR